MKKMFSSSSSLKTLRKPIKPFTYAELSPRTLTFRKTDSCEVIKLQECQEPKIVKPNMELRKNLIGMKRSESYKNDLYNRGQKWKQEISKKLHEKKWDLQVTEMSSCTFTPSLKKIINNRAKSFKQL